MKPLKRLPQLHLLSHDHHQGLLFCWKIRKGITSGIEQSRMHAYTKWFFANHLEPHFREEEEQYFPLLGQEHALLQRAVTEHRELERLCAGSEGSSTILQQFTDTLEAHIRFEERELFEAMQQQVTPQQWEELEKKEHVGATCDEYHDTFWL